MDHFEIKEQFNQYLKKRDIDGCLEFYNRLPEQDKLQKDFLACSVILKISKAEEVNGESGLLSRGSCNDVGSMEAVYNQVKHAIRRIEFGIDKSLAKEIMELRLSNQMLLMIVSLFSYDRRKTAGLLHQYYIEAGDNEAAHALYILANDNG